MFSFYIVLRCWQEILIENMENNPLDLLTSSYYFDLPSELIAQRPIDSKDRGSSRLLVYNKKLNTVHHDTFKNIHKYLPENSTLVFNQSKVFPSRLKGQKLTGGKAEVFLLSPKANEDQEYEVLIKARGKKNVSDQFSLAENVTAVISKVNHDGTFQVKFSPPISEEYLEKNALVPIPPYIRNGESDEKDKIDYQTKYAKDVGSVAAPTAGLHFTNELLEQLKVQGHDQAFVTLHVGIGTFRPVMVENIKDHQMHYEPYSVDAENLLKINKAGANLVPVGTTSLRTIFSMKNKNINPNEFYSTNIFLHPGADVSGISGLVTNFHLPESTLLMLVSALIGREKTLELYQVAIDNKYRFFSYGDGMLIVL